MIIRWFLSSTVRHAVAMRSHVEKLLAAQRDVLSPQAIQNVNDAIAALRKAMELGADKVALVAQMKSLEDSANKWLKPYPNAAWRENVEVLLVAIGVAMAIRTFFLQPFKIPTGSMQPTLYGVTSNPDFKTHPALPEDNSPRPDFAVPNAVECFLQYWIGGVSYKHIVAKSEGAITALERPKHFLLFTIFQRFQVGDEWYSVWFPPDDLLQRAGLAVTDVSGYLHLNPRIFKKGDDIIKIRVIAGDHLFVNRVTYNFRHPKRGEIIVFSTKGFDPEVAERYGIAPNQFYIKRLVALGGEHVRIGDDQHLVINGQRLDSTTPHFESVYNFRANAGENQYFGHTFAADARAFLINPSQEYSVQTDHYMVMGDNTRNSLDSRYIGDFPREYVIGKSSFVYWPITSRFGFGYR